MRLRPTISDGPGDRMSAPSSSWISLAFTAEIRSQPARAAIDAVSTGLPHHEARMICGSRSKIGRAQSELQSRLHLVCRLLLEKKKKYGIHLTPRTTLTETSCHSA